MVSPYTFRMLPSLNVSSSALTSKIVLRQIVFSCQNILLVHNIYGSVLTGTVDKWNLPVPTRLFKEFFPHIYPSWSGDFQLLVLSFEEQQESAIPRRKNYNLKT